MTQSTNPTNTDSIHAEVHSTHWLHYIGKSYYSTPNFIREAKSVGVSRKVALRMLSGLNWGDRIYLAQGDKRSSKRTTPFDGSDVFGYFTLERIALDIPLSKSEGSQHLIVPATTTEVDIQVVRGCGTYEIVRRYQVLTPMSELSEYLRINNPNAQVFLQGTFTELPVHAHLSEYGMRWGYQRIDEVLFGTGGVYEQALDELLDGDVPIDQVGPVVIDGTFPTYPDENLVEPVEGEIAELGNYQVGDYWGPSSGYVPSERALRNRATRAANRAAAEQAAEQAADVTEVNDIEPDTTETATDDEEVIE